MPLYTFINKLLYQQSEKIHIQLYTILKQGIRTIFIEQIPNYLIFKKHIIASIKIFNSLPYRLITIKHEQA
jgi:hypothetical protein